MITYSPEMISGWDDAPLPGQSLSPEGILVAVNRRWVEFTGYEPGERIGKPYIDLVPTAHHDDFRAPRAHDCRFYESVARSPMLRVKYATMYPYCKGGEHQACMRWWLMDQGNVVPDDLLPDGGKDNFLESSGRQHNVRQRVLVVDDMPLFRKSLITLVSNATSGAAEVTEADSAEQALEKLASTSDPWTLVVTDYNMGGMNGYELIMRMRMSPALAAVPVIVFSSETQTDVRDRCSALPRVRWLEKRPDFGPFEEAWRALVTEHRP